MAGTFVHKSFRLHAVDSAGSGFDPIFVFMGCGVEFDLIYGKAIFIVRLFFGVDYLGYVYACVGKSGVLASFKVIWLWTSGWDCLLGVSGVSVCAEGAEVSSGPAGFFAGIGVPSGAGI